MTNRAIDQPAAADRYVMWTKLPQYLNEPFEWAVMNTANLSGKGFECVGVFTDSYWAYQVLETLNRAFKASGRKEGLTA